MPPYRYGVDFGYRSGYELAWRDWLNHGRHDRYWRRSAFYGYGSGYTYRAGYEAGWRDAALYYSRGYRPNYWSYDSSGGWYWIPDRRWGPAWVATTLGLRAKQTTFWDITERSKMREHLPAVAEQMRTNDGSAPHKRGPTQ